MKALPSLPYSGCQTRVMGAAVVRAIAHPEDIRRSRLGRGAAECVGAEAIDQSVAAILAFGRCERCKQRNVVLRIGGLPKRDI